MLMHLLMEHQGGCKAVGFLGCMGFSLKPQSIRVGGRPPCMGCMGFKLAGFRFFRLWVSGLQLLQLFLRK